MTRTDHVEYKPHPALPRWERRARLLASNGIDVVVDVGGWIGAYGANVRKAGFSGRIISFEPLSHNFSKLKAAARSDSGRWDVHHTALGSRSGTATLNVTRESGCTTLLRMEPRHFEVAPESEVIGTEVVRVARLDELWRNLDLDGSIVYLKIDVQGFELEVLSGLGPYLSNVAVLELELSLVPLYERGPVWNDVADHLRERGFRLASLESVLDDFATGEMLQGDGIFLRVESGGSAQR